MLDLGKVDPKDASNLSVAHHALQPRTFLVSGQAGARTEAREVLRGARVEPQELFYCAKSYGELKVSAGRDKIINVALLFGLVATER